MSFHPIDMQTWPMAQTFYYYTQIAPTTYSITVPVDVTIMRNTLKASGFKFFPAYLYAVTKALQSQKEFCIAKQDEAIGYFDYLNPVYPQFHEDDKTTSLLWTEYNEDFSVFYKHYIVDTTSHGNSKGILSSKGMPPTNSCVISCIPWFTFNSFSLNRQNTKDYFFPSFEAGAFVEKEDGHIVMPLSITVHHATIEGYHLKCFSEELQKIMNNSLDWVSEQKEKLL